MTMTDVPTVVEATEATARRMMAKRANLPDVWQHRAERRALLAELDDVLDAYLQMTTEPCA